MINRVFRLGFEYEKMINEEMRNNLFQMLDIDNKMVYVRVNGGISHFKFFLKNKREDKNYHYAIKKVDQQVAIDYAFHPIQRFPFEACKEQIG